MQAASVDKVFNTVVLALEQTADIDGRYLSPETHLVIDLQLRGFDRIKLAIYLEEAFDVELLDDEVNNFNTVGDIARFMSRCPNSSAN